MDAPTGTAPAVRINHFLPYWAVLVADVKQTLRSWIYRLWALASLGAVGGYLLYRIGAKRQGFIQPAPELVHDLINWIVWGSITLIIVLTASAICGERGTMADSVLSRGISRTQYFLGKFHSRLFVILGTFLVLALGAMTAAMLVLDSESLSIMGCFMALAVVASILTMIVACSVSISALSSTTVVAITVVWVTLYGVGFVLSLLPERYPSPDRAMQILPLVLRGGYDVHLISRIVAGALSASLFMTTVGMIGFSRRDV